MSNVKMWVCYECNDSCPCIFANLYGKVTPSLCAYDVKETADWEEYPDTSSYLDKIYTALNNL